MVFLMVNLNPKVIILVTKVDVLSQAILILNIVMLLVEMQLTL